MKTEDRNEGSYNIDRVSTTEALRIMNGEDKRVPLVIEGEIQNISEAIDEMIPRLERGGRIVYVGAGTSGRIGVLDCSELKPTFNFDNATFLIAGGRRAVFESIEGAEDKKEDGGREIGEAQVGEDDCVIGLAASGRTPYTLGALDEARDRGALTIFITCNPGVERVYDHTIAIDVGAEVIAGSTRLKGGTAQKLVLNMISTVLMVRLGKVYHNLMVDLDPMNAKLVERAVGIIMESTGAGREQSGKAFEESGRKPKTAIVMLRKKLDKKSAEEKLSKNGLDLRKTLEV